MISIEPNTGLTSHPGEICCAFHRAGGAGRVHRGPESLSGFAEWQNPFKVPSRSRTRHTWRHRDCGLSNISPCIFPAVGYDQKEMEKTIQPQRHRGHGENGSFPWPQDDGQGKDASGFLGTTLPDGLSVFVRSTSAPPGIEKNQNHSALCASARDRGRARGICQDQRFDPKVFSPCSMPYALCKKVFNWE